jgi:hypothetical protein
MKADFETRSPLSHRPFWSESWRVGAEPVMCPMLDAANVMVEPETCDDGTVMHGTIGAAEKKIFRISAVLAAIAILGWQLNCGINYAAAAVQRHARHLKALPPGKLVHGKSITKAIQGLQRANDRL